MKSLKGFLTSFVLFRNFLSFSHVLLSLTNLESELFIAESHVFSRNETSQENVNALTYREGHGDYSISSRNTVEAANEV
jgi:hypothetical protein